LKDKINKPGSNSKNKNIRDMCRFINEFKKHYHPGSNLLKDERCDLLVDAHKILNSLKKYSFQALECERGG
jgi:hypothetical protein